MKQPENYSFKIDWTSSKPFNPESDAVDVVVIDEAGKTYYGNFVTQRFISEVTEKNKRTGECASGSYFSMPGMVVVGRIDDEHIRNTIDDLLKTSSFFDYFQTQKELSGKL